MYYSYLSTGNVRIDSEHANIDCMVDLCPFKDRYREFLEKEVEIPVKIGTHDMHKPE